MALALAQILPRFGNAESGGKSRADSMKPVEELVADAEKRGRAEALAESRVEIEAVRAEAEAGIDRRLAEARRQWAETEGDRLAASLSEALGQLEARLGAGAARVLTPFIGTLVREHALVELSGIVSGLCAGEAAPLLRVTGPADLLAELGRRLDAGGISAELVPGDGVDVKVVLGETLVETQLDAWAARLAGAVAAHD